MTGGSGPPDVTRGPDAYNPYAPPGSNAPQQAPGHGLPLRAPGAKEALIYGILSFVCCGAVMGPFAIINANKAKQAIAADPTLTGGGMATTGMVLGIIALVLNLLAIVARLAATH